MLDLNQLSDLVDLFMFLPNSERVNDQQCSPQLHGVLSSNLKDKATAEKSTESPADIHLRRTMEFIWIRIQERFKTFSPAFRFFDRSCVGKITLDQFVIALETLKVKLSSKDLSMVFNHLDQERKGFIDYSDFCNLSDERRMKIDPAAAMLKEYKETGKIVQKTNAGVGLTKSPSRRARERRANSSMGMHTQKTEL